MPYETETRGLIDAMVGCKVPVILAAVNAALAAGMSPTEIVDAMSEGMSKVGVYFERGKLFLPHVLSAAAGMNKTMEKLGPMMAATDIDVNRVKAKVAMGTVEGDVHDIGKSICSTMLQCAGFEVHDLGRDVPLDKFVAECENGCTFCGMSALMTTTMVCMPVVIEKMKEKGIRDNVTIMVGGAPVTQAYCEKIGADIYGESANETTSKAKAIAGDV
ncbi:MAG: dimethylamine corrinoid protein 3 [Thermoplasmata archaeon]|nr:dimethylamine corrinoid protein 3 [Thermoplasmata archaeon]